MPKRTGRDGGRRRRAGHPLVGDPLVGDPGTEIPDARIVPVSKIPELAEAFRLPWSHYVQLLAVEDSNARDFYEADLPPSLRLISGPFRAYRNRLPIGPPGAHFQATASAT